MTAQQICHVTSVAISDGSFKARCVSLGNRRNLQ
jgi:hypothetical protein